MSAWALLAAVLLGGAEPRSYDRGARVRYLERALDAVAATDPRTLEQAETYVGAMQRGSCSSPLERLRLECLVAAAERRCRSQRARERCALYTDIIVTNALGERYFLSVRERYELMQRSRDPRRAIRRELRRAQGELAVDLRLSSGECGDASCLAAGIDRYCMAAGDARGLPWQSCAAALVWFIGTSAPK